MQKSVYQIQNKSQYKHQGVNRSKTTTSTTTSAFVVFGNVLEASLTNCVDQTVPDVGESDLDSHDLPVCLYADVVLCVFYIRGSRNFRQGGGGGEGIQAEKSSIAWKKNSGKLLFLVCF